MSRIEAALGIAPSLIHDLAISLQAAIGLQGTNRKRACTLYWTREQTANPHIIPPGLTTPPEGKPWRNPTAPVYKSKSLYD